MRGKSPLNITTKKIAKSQPFEMIFIALSNIQKIGVCDISNNYIVQLTICMY